MSTKKNGQQRGQENLKAFKTWIAQREKNNDWLEYVQGVKLKRKDMAQECLMSRSAFLQNPEIKKTLQELEEDLRARGILPLKMVRKTDEALSERDIHHNKHQRDLARLSRLEQENAALRAENAQLKAALTGYALLEEALAETGRVPRPC